MWSQALRDRPYGSINTAHRVPAQRAAYGISFPAARRDSSVTILPARPASETGCRPASLARIIADNGITHDVCQVGLAGTAASRVHCVKRIWRPWARPAFSWTLLHGWVIQSCKCLWLGTDPGASAPHL